MPLLPQGVDLVSLFLYAVLTIAVARVIFNGLLSAFYNLRRPTQRHVNLPPVCVVIPAYNEEKTIESCARSILRSSHQDFYVVVVDDGSTDATGAILDSMGDSRLKVVHQNNMGKAHALNSGIRRCRGEIIVTVDADSRLDPEALTRISAWFAEDPSLGAVAGNVKVEPQKGVLNLLQSAEYTSSININRKSQSVLRSVMIVPGPIAAIRRTVLEEVGGFPSDTFAEDFDVTMRILKAGYDVRFEDRALCYTVAPHGVEDLMKQRRRWYRGMVQVLAKHEDMYLRTRYGVAGVLGVPNLWFDLFSPILNISFAFLLLLAGVLTGRWFLSFQSFAVYWMAQTLFVFYSLALDPVKRFGEWLVAPVIFLFNVFMDGVRIGALVEETMDTFMGWEKPQR